jgi:DNA polymerase-3 subunit delta'
VALIPLYGHHALRQRLLDNVQRGNLPASLLLAGPPGVGKQRLALWLGQALLCDASAPPCGVCRHCKYVLELAHPDLVWFFPRPRLRDSDAELRDVRADYAEARAERLKSGGLYAPPDGTAGIYVATVRAIVRDSALSPALARRKVFVIGDADRMISQEGSDQAANALLKLLEEPLPDTVVVLTSSEPGALLPTIRSRVVSVRVGRVSDADTRAFVADELVTTFLGLRSPPPAQIDQLVSLAQGAPGLLLEAADRSAALAHARRLLEAATSGDRQSALRVAMGQGAARARGAFSDALDALTVLLHDRAREAAERGDEVAALGASRALFVVEDTKARTASNVNPQLLTAVLLRNLASILT